VCKLTVLHTESDGVFGSPHICEELVYQGEICSLNRVARLMQQADIAGIPTSKQWRRRKSFKRPDDVINHLERNFTASASDTVPLDILIM
jgi:putative transposase